MRLIQNESADNHKTAVREVIEGAEQVSLAVAFMKDRGARILVNLLEERLKQGAVAEAFVGTDFYITEPEALRRLLALRRRYPSFEVFLADRAPSTFHPKTYVGRKGDRVRCLIGSANLTAGAMATNSELSILVEAGSRETLSKDLIATFDGFRNGGRFQLLDKVVLDQYRSRYEVAERARRKLERDLDDNLPPPFDLRRLDAFIGEYRADRGERDALRVRRESRRNARRVQIEIAELQKTGSLSKADRDVFENDLRDLMSSKDGRPHYWLSGSIHRQGSNALRHPKETVALFAKGREAARLTRESGYEAMRPLAQGIRGVGVNMVTEILCTFNPSRFAVFNGNTAGALASIGVATPTSRTVNALSGRKYAGLCETVDAVRERVGGVDFTDADAFLNWLYFKTKPRKAR